MLKYGNRDFRSLQEQVYANMRNIEDIIKGQDIMADYTLQIVGQVDTAAELPDAETYDGKLGDIYVVGEQSPFHGYAFVKVYENENVPSWVDLGPILVQGPQGEQGEQGPQGIQGEKGDQGVPAGFGVPTASIQGGVGTPNVSITASGPNTARVFDFTFYNLKGETGAQGPEGPQGATGATGATGPQGPQGPKGPKGDKGAGVPEIESGDAGKALMVNASETAAEWTELPSGLPDIKSGDAGKALIVNAGETAAEWADIPDELPAITTGDAGKVLAVNSTETGIEWIGRGPEILDIVISSSISTSSFYGITLTEAQVTKIAADLPIIRLTFSNGTGPQVLLYYAKSSGSSIYYLGMCDKDGTRAPGIILNNGEAIACQSEYNVRFIINTSTATVTGGSSEYVKFPTAWNSINPCKNLGITGISSGNTITNTPIKNTIKASGVFQVNDRFVYPMFRDTTNASAVISYYYNIISDSNGNLEQTVYKITEADWVITFITKTIS